MYKPSIDIDWNDFTSMEILADHEYDLSNDSIEQILRWIIRQKKKPWIPVVSPGDRDDGPIYCRWYHIGQKGHPYYYPEHENVIHSFRLFRLGLVWNGNPTFYPVGSDNTGNESFSYFSFPSLEEAYGRLITGCLEYPEDFEFERTFDKKFD